MKKNIGNPMKILGNPLKSLVKIVFDERFFDDKKTDSHARRDRNRTHSTGIADSAWPIELCPASWEDIAHPSFAGGEHQWDSVLNLTECPERTEPPEHCGTDWNCAEQH